MGPESLPCAKLFRLSGKLVPLGCCLAHNIGEPPESLGVLGNDSLGSAIKCATNLASSLQTASTPSVTTCEDDHDDDWLEDDLPEVNTAMVSLDSSHSPSIWVPFL